MSSALKYIEIRKCCKIESINICGANLVSFCIGDRINLLRNVPQLVDISICADNDGFIEAALNQLPCWFSQLETLKLDGILCLIIWFADEHEVFPMLENLKHLETFGLDDHCNLLQLNSFVMASPYLLKLGLNVISIQEHLRNEKKDTPPKCSHDHLREVEIRGFEGCPVNFQLLDYLTKTAVKRENIVTSPLKSVERRGRKYDGLKAKHPLVLLIGENGNDRGNERALGSVLPETVVRRRWSTN
ncbi:hypothetical protein FF1_014270 [Malus domestica]